LTKVPKSGGRRRKNGGGKREKGKTRGTRWDPRAANGRPLVAGLPMLLDPWSAAAGHLPAGDQ
jgi:hypothetical protein